MSSVCQWIFSICCLRLLEVSARAALANMDLNAASVRIVDAAGSLSNRGLVQVRTENPMAVEYGTVCGLNGFAADVICRQLGYSFGSVGSSPCSMYAGSDMCGAVGTPVAMKALECDGTEFDLKNCRWEAPDETCLRHGDDSIVFCGSIDESESSRDGAVRLLSYDGSPSIDGVGRVEVFRGGSWAPVCRSGFTAGAASVICSQMSFVGAQSSEPFESCGNVNGRNFCGTTPPRTSEVACTGQEHLIAECSFEADSNVYCAPEESIVVSCLGDGDTQGRPTKGAPVGPQ